MNKPLAYVYKWTHIPTGKWYIGSRTSKKSHPDDGYICSSKDVKPMILEKRDEWKREIIHTGDPKQMRLYEKTLLKTLDAMNDTMSFNKVNCAGTMNDGSHIRGKKRIHKGDVSKLVLPNELEEYLNNGWKLGQTLSHRQKNSKANKGITRLHHGHGKGGAKKGSIPWNKGRKETRLSVLINQSTAHGGDPSRSRSKTLKDAL